MPSEKPIYPQVKHLHPGIEELLVVLVLHQRLDQACGAIQVQLSSNPSRLSSDEPRCLRTAIQPAINIMAKHSDATWASGVPDA